MTEQNGSASPTPEDGSDGDPRLGPQDVRLEMKLSLIGQRKILIQDDFSIKLTNALSLPARGGVAAIIESGVQSLVQNAVTQFNELILARAEKAATNDPVGQRSPAGSKAPDFPDDFPERLPPPPPKT